MYELVLTVCLMAQPESCRIQRLPFQEPMGITRCMIEGQMYLAQWLSEHPQWQLKSWRCDLPKA